MKASWGDRTILILAAAALLVSVPADARRRPGEPVAEGPIAYAPPHELSHPAVWLEVKQPAKVRDALRKNAWLAEVLQKPLGKGFLGSWGAFLGTRGEDVRATFKGAVADAILAQLFEQPFRISWYTAPDGTYSPALVVPAPGQALKLGHAALDQVARRGAVSSRCPGDAGPGFLIARWALAEHVLFTALKDDRLVVARFPGAIVQAYCAGDTSITAGGSDVELSLSPALLSRGAQVGANLLGLGSELTLKLDVEHDRLVPRGLAGPLPVAARLAKGALNDELLRLLPASAPVALTVQLNLPELIDLPSLKAFWKQAQSLPLLARTATVAWWPRGDNRPQEVALLWSRTADAAALASIFDGKNKLASGQLCGAVALASSAEVLERLRRACEGSEPSFKDLGDKVTHGLRAEHSLSLSVQAGSLLKTLAADGYRAEASAGAPDAKTPPEVEEALRELSALPFLGFAGTASSAALQPRGFWT